MIIIGKSPRLISGVPSFALSQATAKSRELEQQIRVVPLRGELRSVAAGAHLLEVAACGEGPARARQHDHTHARIVARVVERPEQLVDHLRPERVLPLRNVQGDRRDAVLGADEDRLVATVLHGRVLLSLDEAMR
jgi:hypothetical protein